MKKYYIRNMVANLDEKAKLNHQEYDKSVVEARYRKNLKNAFIKSSKEGEYEIARDLRMLNNRAFYSR